MDPRMKPGAFHTLINGSVIPHKKPAVDKTQNPCIDPKKTLLSPRPDKPVGGSALTKSEEAFLVAHSKQVQTPGAPMNAGDVLISARPQTKPQKESLAADDVGTSSGPGSALGKRVRFEDGEEAGEPAPGVKKNRTPLPFPIPMLTAKEQAAEQARIKKAGIEARKAVAKAKKDAANVIENERERQLRLVLEQRKSLPLKAQPKVKTFWWMKEKPEKRDEDDADTSMT